MILRTYLTACFVLLIIVSIHPGLKAQNANVLTPVFMTMANVEQTDSTYAFDVMVETPDTFLLNTYQIYITYDTAAFGSHVVMNGCFDDTVEANPNVVLYDSFPAPFSTSKYQMLNIVDNSYNILAITADTRFFVPTPACYPVDEPRVTMWRAGERKPVARVIMNYKDTSHAPGVSLVLSLMLDQFIGGNASCELVQGDLGILPLTFNYVEAEGQENGQVKLDWEVEGLEVESFMVERQNATGQFDPVDLQIHSKEQGYTATDNPNFDGVAYYRIRATGIDGVLFYSETVEVEVEALKMGYALELSPNPADAYIDIHNPLVFPTTGKIYDMQGRLQWDGVVTSARLSLEMLPKGLYVLQVQAGTKRAQARFLKK